MRRHFLRPPAAALLLCLCAATAHSVDIPQDERCIAFEAESPFALHPVADTALLAGGAALYGGALLWKYLGDFPEYDGTQRYDKNDVNAFDRWAMNPYRHGVDIAGTITCALDMAVIPVGLFGTEFLLKNLPARDALTALVMYGECVLWAQGIKDMLKQSVQRTRPYMYFDQKDMDSIDNHDFTFSWPSGHSIDSFTGAAFVSYVFCQYYPDSHFKVPVIAASYVVAAGTAALRMASGNHFFTDVLTGASIGTFIGFGVPLLHQLFARSASARSGKKGAAGSGEPRLTVTSFSPLGCSVQVRF